jgi:hypothetical protein
MVFLWWGCLVLNELKCCEEEGRLNDDKHCVMNGCAWLIPCFLILSLPHVRSGVIDLFLISVITFIWLCGPAVCHSIKLEHKELSHLQPHKMTMDSVNIFMSALGTINVWPCRPAVFINPLIMSYTLLKQLFKKCKFLINYVHGIVILFQKKAQEAHSLLEKLGPKVELVSHAHILLLTG